MMRTRFLTASVAVALCFNVAEAKVSPETPALSIQHEAATALSSSSSSLLRRESAGPDTFALFGGPGTLEGKFQNASGLPDWQGWVSRDETESKVYWQVSTHNAANLNNNGAGNLAYWCGQTAAQQPHWVHTPGYGRSWNAIIQYESAPVANPAVGDTLNLDFFFNHDTEPGYDYLQIEVESAGTWVRLHGIYGFDGTNHDASNVFPPPGLRFSDVGQPTYVFAGNDYGGPNGDRIRVRIRVTSDGAFDDQTGLWPTVGGAAQIDDISLSHSGVSFFEDFEGGGPYLFQPVSQHFVGDFTEIFPHVTDIDPYAENASPVAMFVDYGQVVRNGPDPDGVISTGGSTSPNWSYGLDSGHVVNYTGGLGGANSVDRQETLILSPWFDWDLPGTDDDADEIRGAYLRFDVYNHLPLLNGIFYRWAIGPGISWGDEFADDNTVYYSQNGPTWMRHEADVTEYISIPPKSQYRIALSVIDLATNFNLPGGDATPAPYFDNVQMSKFRLGGVRIQANNGGLSQNTFPTGTSLDVSTPSARAALVISATSQSSLASLEAEFKAFIDTQTITDKRIVWAMKKNLLFEDALRPVPAGLYDENVVTGPLVWTGEKIPHTSNRSRFGFELIMPVGFFPGDQTEFYFKATDNSGRVTTLPADLTGFGNFDGTFNPRFSFRGIPTITDVTGTQPRILLYAGGGENVEIALAQSALGELGMLEGVDYDVYYLPTQGTRKYLGPSANQILLDGYETIMCFGGGGNDYRLPDWLVFGNTQFAEGRGFNDTTITMLTNWSNRAGDRNLVYFGSYLGFSLDVGAASAPLYLSDEMNVDYIDEDIRPDIGDQLAPAIQALGSGFATDFVVGGNSETWCGLEHVVPIAPAVRAHTFSLPGGGSHATAAASVLKVEAVGVDTKVNLTFPFGFRFVQGAMHRAPGNLTARAQLMQEILAVVDAPPPSGSPTSAPELRNASLRVSPNPFNPRTSVEFVMPQAAHAIVEVFNVRGQRIRTLHSGDLDEGPHRFDWDGRDGRGGSVASGVYIVRAQAPGIRLETKALLVK